MMENDDDGSVLRQHDDSSDVPDNNHVSVNLPPNRFLPPSLPRPPHYPTILNNTLPPLPPALHYSGKENPSSIANGNSNKIKFIPDPTCRSCVTHKEAISLLIEKYGGFCGTKRCLISENSDVLADGSKIFRYKCRF